MKILLTGSEGLIGREVQKQLRRAGHEVQGFDLKTGNDIRSPSGVIDAGGECDAVVHLAALLGNSEDERAEDIARTNILGTSNVLECARLNGLGRVIFMSSADALGIFKGEGTPAYFPFDDAHPCKPTTPYAISKKIAEEMCDAFTDVTNIPSICLRPPGVWDEQTYFDIIERRRERPAYEWDPYWEYGAFIDVRDLAALVIKCLESDFTGRDCFLVSSDDITTSGKTSLELTQILFPHVKWPAQDRHRDDPYRSLLDCSRVQDTFRWSPTYSWKRFIEENSDTACKRDMDNLANRRTECTPPG